MRLKVYNMLKAIIKEIGAELSNISSAAGSSLIQLLVLALYMVPLHPLELVVLAVAVISGFIYFGAPLLVLTSFLAYTLISILLPTSLGLIFMSSLALFLMGYSRRYKSSAASLILLVITLLTLVCANDIGTYLKVLTGYPAKNYEAVMLHASLLPMIALYVIASLPPFKDTKLGNHLTSNPETYLALQAVVSLVYALMNLESKLIARMYTDIAFFSLVSGAALIMWKIFSADLKTLRSETQPRNN